VRCFYLHYHVTKGLGGLEVLCFFFVLYLHEVENEARSFAQNQWKTRERRELSQKSRQVQHSQEGLHTHYYNNGAKRVDTGVSDAEKVGIGT